MSLLWLVVFSNIFYAVILRADGRKMYVFFLLSSKPHLVKHVMNSFMSKI